MKVDPDWWKHLFDEMYLITDARTVCDHGLTCREVDFLEEILGLQRSWPILDLCGGEGRHSLELCRRGFRDVTVLDYSRVLIERGRERAQKEGLITTFIRKDARETGLPDRRFRVIIVMASSLGYFLDESQDEAVLRETFRLLTPRGTLLLDLPDRAYILNNVKPQSWHEANEEIVVCRQRRRDGDMIYTREMVISKTKGLIRDATYCTRLYSPQSITARLKSAGFDSVTIQKGFVLHEKSSDYGLMSHRMIAVARKP